MIIRIMSLALLAALIAVFVPATSTSAVAGPFAAATASIGAQNATRHNVHYRKRYHRHRKYRRLGRYGRRHHRRYRRYRGRRIVRAPFTRVETGRRVIVDAPFAHVRVGRGVRVRAPFVDLWVPRYRRRYY